MTQNCADCERVGALEKRFERIERLIGHGGDKITGSSGEGLYGAVEDMLGKVDLVISEQTRKRETPGRIVRMVLLAIPIVGAASAAINWLYSHLRIVP